MFNERELILLAILLGSDEWILGRTLAGMLNVGNRTLQSEIAAINEILTKNSGSSRIVSNNRLGYRLEGNREQIKKYVAEKGAAPARDSFESANNILTVLLYEKDFITLNNIADKTFLAASSVSANLERVKKMIGRARNAKLIVHPRKGYRLEAEEYIKRMLIVNALSEEISETGRQYREIVEGYELLNEVKEILINALVPVEYVIEGKAFDAFSRYCAFSITRQLNGYPLEHKEREHEISSISKRIAASFSKDLNYDFSDDELYLLDERLEELNAIGAAKKDYPEMEKLIKEFFAIVSEETTLVMRPDDNYLKRMSEHLYRMSKRVDVGNYLRTNDPETIEKQYPVALHLLRTCFRKVFKENIPGNEERLLVPYISALLSSSGPKVDIRIISDQPVGEIYRYRLSLYETFGSSIGRIRIFPAYLYEEKFANISHDDICLTTEEELVFRHSELTYIDLYEEQYQRDMIAQMIFARSSELKERVFSDYAKQFEKEHVFYDGEICDWKGILSDQLQTDYLDDISASFIDNSKLLMISHGGKEHMQKKIFMKDAIPYQGKSISQILYFNIGRKKDARSFCGYIKETVNKRD